MRETNGRKLKKLNRQGGFPVGGGGSRFWGFQGGLGSGEHTGEPCVAGSLETGEDTGKAGRAWRRPAGPTKELGVGNTGSGGPGRPLSRSHKVRFRDHHLCFKLPALRWTVQHTECSSGKQVLANQFG